MAADSQSDASRPIVLRMSSGLWIPLGTWALLGYFAINAFMLGSWAALGRDLPGLALVGWLVYLVLWAPRVVVYNDHAVVANLLRSYWLPYEAIDDIRIASTLSLQYCDEQGQDHRVFAWNAPGLPRLSTGRHPVTGVQNHTGPGGTPAPAPYHDLTGPSEQLKRRWEAYQSTDAQQRSARITWLWWGWLIAIALAVVCVLPK